MATERFPEPPEPQKPNRLECSLDTNGRSVIVNGIIAIKVIGDRLSAGRRVRVLIVCNKSIPIQRSDMTSRQTAPNAKDPQGIGQLVLTLKENTTVTIGEYNMSLLRILPNGANLQIESPSAIRVETVPPETDLKKLIENNRPI